MKNSSILVVEDKLDQREAMMEYLSIFFDTIYQASNGIEALDVYNKYLPNIILTDLDMPKLNGVDFIQKIREVDNNVNIIIFSAHTNTEDFLKVVSLNLVDYLVKPIQMDKLKAAIFRAVENMSSENLVYLNADYIWNSQTKTLCLENERVELSSYETTFLNILIASINHDVSYETIHSHINPDTQYSQNAIFTLVKRIRKKTTKCLIKSAFKFGYKIEST